MECRRLVVQKNKPANAAEFRWKCLNIQLGAILGPGSDVQV